MGLVLQSLIGTIRPSVCSDRKNLFGYPNSVSYIPSIMIKLESKEEFKTIIFNVSKENNEGDVEEYLVTYQDSFDDFLVQEWDVRTMDNELVDDEILSDELIAFCKQQKQTETVYVEI